MLIKYDNEIHLINSILQDLRPYFTGNYLFCVVFNSDQSIDIMNPITFVNEKFLTKKILLEYWGTNFLAIRVYPHQCSLKFMSSKFNFNIKNLNSNPTFGFIEYNYNLKKELEKRKIEPIFDLLYDMAEKNLFSA
jgi:hypothetical protein